ncbi:MAG TPA: NUDIX domain-containing protein [Clostridia bacterium]|nr:NUDIX domain-containing protein [Clostridia bacterium]
MSKPHGILIFGASGSGTTTLGRELARVLNFTHLDIDDYYWLKSDVPFTAVRPREERQALLLADIKKSSGFVVSGSAVNWDEPILPYLDLAVFVSAPTEVRLERLRKREHENFGDRVLQDGDMYNKHLEFVEWAAGYDTGGLTMRSRALHEQWISNCPCPVTCVDGTADCRETAVNIAERFYTKPGEPPRITLADLGALEKYRFTVIFTRYGGKWLYCRQKHRDTWETAGGHIEKGETPLEGAKRELYEETGATKFYIRPTFDYAVHRDVEFSCGQVYYADIETLGAIPEGSEMAEVKPSDTFPDKLTYPAILPVLYGKMQSWLGFDRVKDERWDVLDENRALKGRTHKRGEPLPEGDHHLVVRVWIINAKGEFLITRRAFNKIGYPGMWEVPSGSALAGEDSLTAAIREAREETGVTPLIENAKLFSTYRRGNSFYDNWLFCQEFDVADITLQEGETIDARAATWAEISVMMERGGFIARDVFPEFGLLQSVPRIDKAAIGRV